MNQQMRDDDFEGLLSRALQPQAAPAGLHDRLMNSARADRSPWFALFLSPAKIAAGAGILSLVLGFALGAGNATVAEDTDVNMAVALYAANDLGDL
jgi:hypothetical protein